MDNSAGGAGNDSFSATLGGSSPTLNAGDAISGGNGTDTLSISSSGGAAVTGAGFTASAVEVISVTAALNNAADDTTINLAGSSGYTTLRSAASASDVVFSNVAGLKTLVAQNTSGGTLDVNYTTSTVAGSTDSQDITLDGATTGVITIAGVETVNIATPNNSTTGTNVFAAATTLNLSGAGTLTTAYGTSPNLKTIDASKMTGALTITVDNASLSVTGGSGNDVFHFTTLLGSDDTVNGGEGSDTISVTAPSTSKATLTSIETLRIGASAAADTHDMDQYAGITTINLRDTDVTNAITLSNLGASQVVSLDTTHVDSVTGTLKTNTSADTLALIVTGVTLSGAAPETLTFNQHETINITSNKSTAGADNTLLTLNATAATTINITGAAATSFGTNLDTASNSNLNASAATGALTVIFGADEGNQKVTGGSGNDSIQLVASGFNQLDTIDGGLGTDTLYLSGTGTVQSTAWGSITGIENIRTTNGATLNLSNAAVNQATGGTLTISGRTIASATALATTTDASAVTSAVTGTIRFTASDSTTAVVDTFTIGAGAHNLSLGADNDQVNVTSTNVVSDNDTFAGGLGTDVLNITATGPSGIASHDLKNVTSFETYQVVLSGNSTTSVLFYEDNIEASTAATLTLNDNGNTATFFIDGRGVTTATKSFTMTVGTTEMTGSDTVYGGAGNDLFWTGEGNDIVDGGAGADTIVGGLGADTMTGGAGADTFRWVAGDRTVAAGNSVTANLDVLSDFSKSQFDKLDFSGLLGVPVATGTLGYIEDPTGATLTTGYIYVVEPGAVAAGAGFANTVAQVEALFGGANPFIADPGNGARTIIITSTTAAAFGTANIWYVADIADNTTIASADDAIQLIGTISTGATTAAGFLAFFESGMFQLS